MLGQEDVEAEFKDLQVDLLTQQKKTFTKWVNSYLGDDKVVDLFEDLADGENLIKLLEIISGRKIGKISTGKTKFHKIENVNKCLHFLNTKVRLESIGAEDIVKGNPRLIMGLLWTLIIGFQIQDIFVSDDDNTKRMARTSRTARESLLLWCQQRTSGYRWIHINDFSSSWRDGMAFCALIHSERPDLIQYQNLNRGDRLKNLETAFNIAEKELGIPKLIEAEDVDVMQPEEKSIMTYLSQFYHVFTKSPNRERIIGRTVTDHDALTNAAINNTVEKSERAQEEGRQDTPNGYLNTESRWTDFSDGTRRTETASKASLEQQAASAYLQNIIKKSQQQEQQQRETQKRKTSLNSPLDQNRPIKYFSAERSWTNFNDRSKQRSLSSIDSNATPNQFLTSQEREKTTSRSLTNITEKPKLAEPTENAKRKFSFGNMDQKRLNNGYAEDNSPRTGFSDKTKYISYSATPLRSNTTSISKSSLEVNKPSEDSKNSVSEDAWACAYCPSVNLSTSKICGSCKRSKSEPLSLSGQSSTSSIKALSYSSLTTSPLPFSPKIVSTKYWTSTDQQTSSSSPFGSIGRGTTVKASSSLSLNSSSSSSSSPFTSNLTSTKYHSINDQQWKENNSITTKSALQTLKNETSFSKTTNVAENKLNNANKTNTSSPMSDNKELGNNLKSSTKWLSNASTRNIQNSTKTSSNTTLNYKMDIKKDETLNGSLETRVIKLENEIEDMKCKCHKALEESNTRFRELITQINLLRNENERLINELDEVPLIKNKMFRLEQMLHKIADAKRY